MIDETKELITAIRHNELEFPSEVAITYSNVDNDYQIGTEYARRITAKHENIITINLPIALTPAEAAKVAEIALNSAWYAGRFSYSFATNYSQLILSPGDLVSLPLSTGNTEVAKITSVDYGPTGMLSYEAIPDLYSIYSSNATGAVGITYEAQSVTGSGPTKMELLDCCMLRDEDTTFGWYSALSGYSSGWPGGTVLKSSDGGATWTQVSASTSSQVASIGITSTLLSNADCRVWDKASTVTVKIFSGNPLYSATEVNVLNGANAALIGSHGRWELIQWLTATLNGDGSYTLSNLLRGRKGTEWAASLHTATDSFIALSSSAVKNITVVSSELNAVKQFKAVTSGQPIEGVTATDYTYTGVRLKPLAPVLFRAAFLPNEDISLRWLRRDRISKPWNSSYNLPLSESSESYEIDIVLDSVIKRTLSSSSEAATYTAAQQVTDGYATANSIVFNLYQLSSTLGRGYVNTISGPKTQKISSSLGCVSTMSIGTQMGTQNATASITCISTVSAYPNDLPRTVVLLHCNEPVGTVFIKNEVFGQPEGQLGTDVGMSAYGAKFGAAGTAHQGISYAGGSSAGKGSIKLLATSENNIPDSSDFCYEFFFYPFTVAGNPYNMHGGTLFAAGSTTIYINGTYNRLYVTEIIYPGPTYPIFFDYPIPNNNLASWKHLAYTKEGSTYRVFINGIKVAEQTVVLNRRFGDIFIGGADDSSNSFAGYIDEVRVTRGTSIYSSSGFTPPTSELTVI